ncbi:hypothetical protein Fmac_023306 [Flemingia macrophylla]|uniref:PUM-HD domain-containing protein n=1 Tax=Flemingia macrophylla TaxID=520843 RepID=A0ABD1LLB2_9FABA
MAQYNHPFVQNPVIAPGTCFSLPSQHSELPHAYGNYQDLESAMKALSFRIPNHATYVDEASLHRMRITGAANHVQHPPTATVLGTPNSEPLVYNLQPQPPRWLWCASMAKDSHGCRTLLNVIDKASPHQIDNLTQGLKDHLHDLIKDPFGNLVIRKFVLSTNVSVAQKKRLIYYFINMDTQKLKDVCTDHQGTRVIQRLLENLKTVNVMCVLAFVYAMEPIIVELMKNVNGGYVIQQCLNLFPPSWNSFLVQKKIKQVNAMLRSRLSDRYVGLSMNKYASNVVEALIKFSETNDAELIVMELMFSLEFGNVIMDPFGNYVVQTALTCTEGLLHESLCHIILTSFGHLHNHPFGKRVLAFARAPGIYKDLDSV